MKKKMYVEPSLQVVKMGVVVLQGGSPDVTISAGKNGYGTMDDNGGGEEGIDVD